MDPILHLVLLFAALGLMQWGIGHIPMPEEGRILARAATGIVAVVYAIRLFKHGPL